MPTKTFIRSMAMDADTLYIEYLSGNARALESLMEMYGDRLTLYINGHVRDLHEAEDLMIESFAYLVDKKPRIKTSFNSYIYKSARNYALAYLRKSKRCVFLIDEAIDFHIKNTFDDEVHISERNEKLYGCMDKLNSAQREALYLVYIEGMSYGDAALILKKTVKQTDKLLQLGKKNIKPLLLKEGIESAFN